jgi:hypothetical protein
MMEYVGLNAWTLYGSRMNPQARHAFDVLWLCESLQAMSQLRKSLIAEGYDPAPMPIFSVNKWVRRSELVAYCDATLMNATANIAEVSYM